MKSATPNRLIHEKSPYLLQHAFNPVDWRPWGKEAHEKARMDNKPIFLSIGYSTCHWCHVMEKESFSNPAIAEILNKNFIPIKLDREERPDIDKIYMTAVQAMSGRGGWPLNVFLTPDLKPFYGGTYFPPEPRWGMQGFPQLLSRIVDLWSQEQKGIAADAERISEALKEMLDGPPIGPDLDSALLDRALNAFEGSFDPEHFGFGSAPKFPVPGNQAFLMRSFIRTQNPKAREMALQTLRAMASGGIYDHLGGGFHRYSTDAFWRLPHFEKMLYDNAQLAVNYLEAYQISKDSFFLKVAQETLEYVLRDMTSPEGAFYSAEDADSLPTAEDSHKNLKQAGEKSEGLFYLWDEAEIRNALGDEADIFCHYYGITPEGNLSGSENGEFEGKNILYIAETLDKTARHFGVSVSEAESKIQSGRKKLLEIRSKRIRPLRDEKIIASWNGLTLSALARGYEATGNQKYLSAAKKAANYIRENLYLPDSSVLVHSSSVNPSLSEGFSDDYAFMAQGLLDLYEADTDESNLSWALELSEKLIKDFAASYGGFYLSSEKAKSGVLHRVMDCADSVEPCSSSVAASVLLRLSLILDREDLKNISLKTLRRFSGLMNERPLSLSNMLSVFQMSLSKPVLIAVSGKTASKEGHALLSEIRRHFIPNRALVFIPENPEKSSLPKLFKEMKTVSGKTTVYVCRDLSCQNPATTAGELSKLLSQPLD